MNYEVGIYILGLIRFNIFIDFIFPLKGDLSNTLNEFFDDLFLFLVQSEPISVVLLKGAIFKT